MVIRSTSSNDIPCIQDLARTIWPVAYASILAPAQLEYMLDTFYSTVALTQQMDSGQQFFILEVEGVPVGFAAVALDEKPKAAKLHKLYVLPQQQGKGWGKALIEHAVQLALKNDQHLLYLNVNRFNPALTFYQKLGFTIRETVDIPIGKGYLMEDFVLQKELKPTNAINQSQVY